MATFPLKLLINDQWRNGRMDELIDLDDFSVLLLPKLLKPYLVSVLASASLLAVGHQYKVGFGRHGGRWRVPPSPAFFI